MNQNEEPKLITKKVLVNRGGFPTYVPKTMTEEGWVTEPPKVTVRPAHPQVPGKPFHLPENVALELKSKAKKKCKRCKGTGVCKWKSRGETAVTCACVRESNEENYERAKKAFAEKILAPLDQAIAEKKHEPTSTEVRPEILADQQVPEGGAGLSAVTGRIPNRP